MRHGHKSKSQRIDGYKRHIVTDLESELILACALTPANRPEAEAVPSLEKDQADKHNTRLDYENRSSDQNDLVTQLQSQLAAAQQVIQRQTQALDQLQQQMLLNGVAPPSPAPTPTTKAKHSTTTAASPAPVTSPPPASLPSTGSRRKRPR